MLSLNEECDLIKFDYIKGRRPNSLPLSVSLCLSEESDYHTDYEEELVGSALSDMEPTNYCSEHTEEELTADTVSIHNHQTALFVLHCYKCAVASKGWG